MYTSCVEKTDFEEFFLSKWLSVFWKETIHCSFLCLYVLSFFKHLFCVGMLYMFIHARIVQRSTVELSPETLSAPFETGPFIGLELTS